MALRKFALNVASLSLARAFQTVASLIAIPIMARLLDPAEFGLAALAMPFMLFAMAISDAGLGLSLIRVPQEDRLAWSSAFWLVFALGAGLSLAMLVIAAPVAQLFEQPQLLPIVAILALAPLLQGLTTLPAAELQQREKFQLLAAIEAAASFGALLSALGLAGAGAGAGVWALVAQATLYWVLKSAMTLAATRFRPLFQFQTSALAGHVAFSRDSAIMGVVAFLQRQVDPLVIGKFLAATPLGFYSVANRIVMLPFQLVTAPAQNALYVKMLALRHDIAAIRDITIMACFAVAVLVFPPMAIAAVSSEAFFVVFLSEKWRGAAIIFSVIAPVGAVQTVAAMWTPMLLATENTALRLRVGVEAAVLWLVILPFAAMHSILAVAAAYTLSYFTYSFVRSYNLYLSPIELGVRAFFAKLSIPILVSLGAAATHLVLARLLHPSPLAEVALALAEMAVSLILLVALCWRTLWDYVGQMRALFLARDDSTAGVHGVAD